MRAVRALGHALLGQGRLDEAEAAYTRALEFARGFHDAGLLYECLSAWADVQLMRGRFELAEAEYERSLHQMTPPPAISIVYVLPSRIRIALARRDTGQARLLIREAELIVAGLPKETQAGVRTGLDAAISATEAATSEPDWPLFHGFLPDEFSPEQRKALRA
jgi:tetratricopeptide (TPR) repeat protein